MIRVLLIHPGIIPHYRVPIYGYLNSYLKSYGFNFIVVSDGIQAEKRHDINFQYKEMPLSTVSIARFIMRHKIDIIIDFMELRNLYLFPTYLIAKGLLGLKMIYWGQARDLLDADARLKNFAYATEQAICDALILYAEHLKKYIPKRFHKKAFVANNTLYMDYPGLTSGVTRANVLAQYGVKTKKTLSVWDACRSGKDWIALLKRLLIWIDPILV